MKKRLLYLSVLLLCCGCGDSGPSTDYLDGYDEGYEEAASDMLSYEDALQYVRENYDVGEVFDSEVLTDYILDTYYPDEIYDLDYLIDYISQSGYTVSESPTKELFYIGNISTHVYHRPGCKSIARMNTNNKKRASREELENAGYTPCDNCNP